VYGVRFGGHDTWPKRSSVLNESFSFQIALRLPSGPLSYWVTLAVHVCNTYLFKLHRNMCLVLALWHRTSVLSTAVQSTLIDLDSRVTPDSMVTAVFIPRSLFFLFPPSSVGVLLTWLLN
jgi:hypothetical protein